MFLPSAKHEALAWTAAGARHLLLKLPPAAPRRRRQITASVTFLPLLSDPCTFDLLVYTASASDVPAAWEESEPRLIATGAAADVKLRSFTTRVHRVDAMVSYRMDD